MALNASQKAKLRLVLLERFGNDSLAAMNELYLGFFETAAQRTARAQAWVAVVRAQRAADKAGADAANTANKAQLDADITELDAITSGV